KFFQKHRLVAVATKTSKEPAPGAPLADAPASGLPLHAPWQLEEVHDASREAFFASCASNGNYVTFYGDNHPDYAGNVVKAMASAKHGAPQVARLFAAEIARAEAHPTPLDKFESLTRFLDEALVPRVVEV